MPAPSSPPTLTTPPDAPAREQAPALFNTRMRAFMAWLITFVSEMGTMATALYEYATSAYGSAGAAASSAGAATAKAGEASDSAAAALESEEAAAGSAAAAANSATAAANAAAGVVFTATSATSNTIGGGSKTWAVGSGLSYQVGLYVIATDSADTGNWMHGQVTDYSGGNLTVNVTRTRGAGTITAWNIGLSGPEGPESIAPVGGIIMWSGSIASIPAGWALCDGSNGTPDLRSKFLVGASATGGYAVGDTGGQTSVTPTITVDNHTLTTAEMPSHTHSYSDIGGGPGSDPVLGGSGASATPQASSSTGGGGAHNHTATSSAVSTLPPYYALAFIMKL